MSDSTPDPTYRADRPPAVGAYPLGWMPRPAAEVESSWLHQVTLLDIEGVQVRLQAWLEEPERPAPTDDQTVEGYVPDGVLARPMLVIGAVRGPSVVYPGEAAAAREELVRQLRLFGVGATPAWTVDRGHRWTEPAAVAHPDVEEPLPDWRERALGIARQMGVSTLVQIADGLWSVLALGQLPSHRYISSASAPVSVTRVRERRCPLQSDPEPGQYCRMRGGPWTSASIRAAAGWFAHRDRLVQAVGCDTCEGRRYLFQGQVFTRGGPINLVPIPMPTRWLAPDETRIAQVEES